MSVVMQTLLRPPLTCQVAYTQVSEHYLSHDHKENFCFTVAEPQSTTYRSDHAFITVAFYVQNPPIIWKGVTYRKFKRIKHHQLGEHLNQQISEILTKDNFDHLAPICLLLLLINVHQSVPGV